MGETRNNFKQALSEMLGIGAEKSAAEPAESEIVQPKEDFASDIKIDPIEPPAAPIEPPVPTPELKFWDEPPQSPYGAPYSERLEETYISQDTVIRGDIESGSNLRIKGKVAGNIACENNIMLFGNVDGNLIARDALVDGGQVMGNLDMRGNLTIQRDARVKGDLNCNNLDLDSAVNGNLRALHKTVFHPNATMVGNISTQSFVVEEGALIEGYVSMKEMQNTISSVDIDQQEPASDDYQGEE